MAKTKFPNNIPYVFILKIIGAIIFIPYVLNISTENKSAWWYQALTGVNSFLIPSIVLSIIRFSIIALYNARHQNRSVRGNFVLGINRLTAILNTMFFIIAAMVAFGKNPIEFVTSLTLVAMAIAVIFRDYITNMLSGLIVMFSDQLSVGDRIKVGEHKGRIIDITFANIELQNEEDDIVMIPNNLVFTNTMVNLSAHRSNLFTVRFELPLQLAIDVNKLENEIMLSFINHPQLDPTNPPKLSVLEIGKDFVKYKIEFYAISSSNQMHKTIQNEVLKQILIYEKGGVE